jgi:hypothetical protein
MRKNLIMSWPQIVMLLIIAGNIVATPDPGNWRFVVGGLLVAIVLLGIIYRVRSQNSQSSAKMTETRASRSPGHGTTPN